MTMKCGFWTHRKLRMPCKQYQEPKKISECTWQGFLANIGNSNPKVLFQNPSCCDHLIILLSLSLNGEYFLSFTLCLADQDSCNKSMAFWDSILFLYFTDFLHPDPNFSEVSHSNSARHCSNPLELGLCSYCYLENTRDIIHNFIKMDLCQMLSDCIYRTNA